MSAAEAPTFGVREPGTAYTERRAAYGVVFGAAETVAVVQGPSGRFWLPGGGSLPGESAKDTLAREVREELGRGVRLTHRLGEATQFFHAAGEDRHYRMQAVFFRADFAGRSSTGGEHELCWLPLDQAGAAFDHECHECHGSPGEAWGADGRVGAPGSAEEAQRLRDVWQRAWGPIRFELSAVAVLRRDRETPFEIERRIPLAAKAK
jgi:ADP-ribose pyrophosphatase YjhB (NUDIX family)